MVKGVSFLGRILGKFDFNFYYSCLWLCKINFFLTKIQDYNYKMAVVEVFSKLEIVFFLN